STAADAWEEYRGLHLLIDAWLEAENENKLLQFAAQAGNVAHPRYTVLNRTGRTACSGPNMQAVPRSSGVRGMYVPRPGHVLKTADYSAVELRTLAQICFERFGFSYLRDVFEAGTDPHARLN